jgi:hypothetical protein
MAAVDAILALAADKQLRYCHAAWFSRSYKCIDSLDIMNQAPR